MDVFSRHDHRNPGSSVAVGVGGVILSLMGPPLPGLRGGVLSTCHRGS